MDFEPPYIANSRDSGEALPRLKWVAPGPVAMDGLDSPSGSDEVDSGPVPPSPLSAAYSQGPSSSFEDRYDGAHPYSKPVGIFHGDIGLY